MSRERGQCLLVGLRDTGERQVTEREVRAWAENLRAKLREVPGPMKRVQVEDRVTIEPDDLRD